MIKDVIILVVVVLAIISSFVALDTRVPADYDDEFEAVDEEGDVCDCTLCTKKGA